MHPKHTIITIYSYWTCCIGSWIGPNLWIQCVPFFRISEGIEKSKFEFSMFFCITFLLTSSTAVVLLLLILCWLLLPLWDFIVLCFVVRYFMSILVLQSSWRERENWLLYLVCLHGVSCLMCRSSSRCHGFVCSLWLWYILIMYSLTILVYFETEMYKR